MKKVVWIIFIFANCILYKSKAQNINVGIHGGTTASKINWVNSNQPAPPGGLSIDYPDTRFRFSYAIGVNIDLELHEKLYIPIQIDYYQKRFAIDAQGLVLVIGNQGELMYVLTDHLDYRLSQMALSSGIGYRILKNLSVEVQPYFHISASQQQIKVNSTFSWRDDANFQQNFDYGIAGYIRGDLGRFYLKGGYQFGIRAINEYTVFDAEFAPIGKLPIRNTMFLLAVGYQVIAK